MILKNGLMLRKGLENVMLVYKIGFSILFYGFAESRRLTNGSANIFTSDRKRAKNSQKSHNDISLHNYDLEKPFVPKKRYFKYYCGV